MSSNQWIGDDAFVHTRMFLSNTHTQREWWPAYFFSFTAHTHTRQKRDIQRWWWRQYTHTCSSKINERLITRSTNRQTSKHWNRLSIEVSLDASEREKATPHCHVQRRRGDITQTLPRRKRANWECDRSIYSSLFIHFDRSLSKSCFFAKKDLYTINEAY